MNKNQLKQLGKKQFAIFKKRPGRPKNTPWRRLRGFINHLNKVWQDNRFTGNRVSRVLRRVFEVTGIKKMIGVNLAVVGLLTTTSLPLGFTSLETPHPELVDLSLQTEKTVQSPLTRMIITQKFHQFHPGLDLKGLVGTPIRPIMEGKVELAEKSYHGYGNYVVINHENGYESLYAHLNEIYAQAGDRVDHETIIGTVGNTGWSTGPHLHLEVWQFKRPLNPLSIIQ